jgi:hypothetical protein
VDIIQQRPERGRAMAVGIGGEHPGGSGQRAAASAAAPALPVLTGRWCSCLGDLNTRTIPPPPPPAAAAVPNTHPFPGIDVTHCEMWRRGACGGVGVLAAASGAWGASFCSAKSPLLSTKDDPYEGVVVDHTALPADPTVFESSLDSSMSAWRERGRRGVWLKIPPAQASLIPAAIAKGFTFHHAEPEYVMLTGWLQPDIPNHLPKNASHQVRHALLLSFPSLT